MYFPCFMDLREAPDRRQGDARTCKDQCTAIRGGCAQCDQEGHERLCIHRPVGLLLVSSACLMHAVAFVTALRGVARISAGLPHVLGPPPPPVPDKGLWSLKDLGCEKKKDVVRFFF